VVFSIPEPQVSAPEALALITPAHAKRMPGPSTETNTSAAIAAVAIHPRLSVANGQETTLILVTVLTTRWDTGDIAMEGASRIESSWLWQSVLTRTSRRADRWTVGHGRKGFHGPDTRSTADA
jgi:hypothetical protein